ncbi:MAG TPA: prepilin-type N-terminal cleavage/methylation domain-containing protein [Gemmatimonadaceae bacterium]|nr:prepilin-type N-terminal cleavage/methylation domain-containing protein [Gemmatimonadaceae bacterium]
MRQVTKGRRRARAEARRGMTLIELMVAMVLLGVGMLGLAGLSLTVGRQFGTGARQADAALVVQSRIDSISTVSCQTLAPSGPVSGTTVTRGITEKWTITDGNDIKTIVDTVTFKGRVKPLVYTSIIPCRD